MKIKQHKPAMIRKYALFNNQCIFKLCNEIKYKIPLLVIFIIFISNKVYSNNLNKSNTTKFINKPLNENLLKPFKNTKKQTKKKKKPVKSSSFRNKKGTINTILVDKNNRIKQKKSR